MGTEYIRDAHNRKIAILTENAGETHIYDMSNRRLGTYNHAMDMTFNSKGQRIGRGDHLARLL